MNAVVPVMAERVEAQVMHRTGRRVREFNVRVSGTTVVLTGRTATFHVKQLALSAVREVFPAARVRNGIEVDD